jgi:predicted nucleotidyltransferase
MRAVDAIHADRTDFKILISIFVSNMAPIADQYPKILALEVFDDRSRFDPHMRRAITLLSFKFPFFLAGRQRDQ